MSATDPLRCADERRRALLRASELNGLDDAEAATDRRSVCLWFFEGAPPELRPEQLRFQGADPPRVIAIDELHDDDPDTLSDCLRIRLDRPGRGCLRLCLIELDDAVEGADRTLRDARGWRAPDGFDPRFACVTVDFEAACTRDIDCAVTPACPPPEREDPELDYLAKDYGSFRRLAFERLARVAPDWHDRLAPDLGATLIEILAYVGDRLSYHQDAVATEAYLGTARRRTSLRRHARLVDYRMHEGCNARAFVHLEVRGDPELDLRDVSFAASLLDAAPLQGPLVPEHALAELPAVALERYAPLLPGAGVAPLGAVHGESGGRLGWRLEELAPPLRQRFFEAHNRIAIHAWGDLECCLPAGSTGVTLVAGPAQPSGHESPAPVVGEKPPDPGQKPPEADEAAPDPWRLRLEPGDLLLFEEVLGPRSGDPADADPGHRHAVRITAVRRGWDPLLSLPLLDVAWADADALPFALCVTSRSDDCRDLTGVSVARGNLVAVDHGHTAADDDLGTVPEGARRWNCVCDRPGDVTTDPARWRPRLTHAPLTHAEPAALDAAAAELLRRDPRRARPQLRLRAVDDPPQDDDGVTQEHVAPPEAPWLPRSDLLASAPDDRHLVAEVDEAGVATLRFGDGELGARPRAGRRFLARVRVGNGPAGNVPAEAIAHLVWRSERPDGVVGVRNPLPAVGGTAPEALDEVRMLAPWAAAGELRRAVAPEDYAAVAMRDFAVRVQRAAAVWRVLGSREEIALAIDARGASVPDPELLAAIGTHLEPYRRIGHDLRVVPAAQVALDLALELCLSPTASRRDVLFAVRARLGAGRLPDGTLGRFHPDAVSFGEGVRVSVLTAAAAAVPGVVHARVTRLRRRFAAPGSPDDAIERGILRLAPLEVPRLDDDPAAPEHGRLELVAAGGR